MRHVRRAKIVCTLGPATSSPRRIRELVYAGMDVARLNMSHGSHEDHAEAYRLVREASDASGHGVGIFADLQGPKIRLETFVDGPVQLRRGQEWVITTRDVPGDDTICGTTYKGLPGDVNVGDPLLIDDGKIRLRVTGVVDGTDVHTEVLVGGKVSNNKGINLPGVAVSVPALSEKDIEDLRFALHLTVDFIALSFVRDAKDADDVRKIMDEEGIHLPIIAKIEKPQAIENLDEVIAAFDGFMVARGDAVMLSGETSVGEFPVHTVETMARIITSTEEHAIRSGDGAGVFAKIDWDPHTRSGVIAKAAEEVAERVEAKYVVAFTTSGDSARRMSRLRGPVPVLAFTPVPAVRSQLALSWGVETFLTQMVEHTDEMVRQVDDQLLQIGRVKEGDLVVIIAGAPPGIPGSTNALRIHRMGDAINEVAPAYRRQPR